MCPEVDFFGLSLPTYGLCSFLGFWMSIAVSSILVTKRNIRHWSFFLTSAVAALGLFVGSHLLYGITRIKEIAEVLKNYTEYGSFLEVCSELSFYFSGMVFYGGMYGLLICGVLFAKICKYPVRDICDVYAVVIPLFHIFGRIGCFFAGCCYGKRWQYGISGRVIVDGVREHARRVPIQLIEATLMCLLFVLMLVLFAKKKFSRNLIFIYLCTYAVIRFVLEFFRGDVIRGSLFGLSTSQWISIFTILWVSIYLLLRKKKNKQKT